MQLPSNSQRRFFEQAAASYHQQLASDTAAQAYLTSRGISPGAASTFRLGVVRKALVGHERFFDRLSIPYLTQAGVVNFTFRCIAGHKCSEHQIGTDLKTGKPVHCSKYLNPELPTTLYNVGDLETTSQTIHVCEGELDALTLSTAGLPAIGAPGVSSWKPWHTICLADFAEVFVWADPDAAGRKFARFMEKEIKARRVALPLGEDVNAIYVRSGAAGLHELINRE